MIILSPVFSNSSVSGKSVFEKLRFRDGLAWTEGLTEKLKLHFQNPSAQRGQGPSVRLRLSESNILLLLIFGGIESRENETSIYGYT